ncbi:hypothetical protein ACFL4C_01715 [Candidatus Omnitrophota bacterium]
MDRYELSRGEGRAKVNLLAYYMGSDLVLCIYNDMAHIGAVAVGEYDHAEKRASTSVITRLGHKDDAIAQAAAHAVSKATKSPACVIAGVHLDGITGQEIDELLKNSSIIVEAFISLQTSVGHV